MENWAIVGLGLQSRSGCVDGREVYRVLERVRCIFLDAESA